MEGGLAPLEAPEVGTMIELNDIDSVTRRRMLAALGRQASAISPDEKEDARAEATKDERHLRERLRRKFPDDADYYRALRQSKQLRRDRRFIERAFIALKKQERERAWHHYFLAAAKAQQAPRHIAREWPQLSARQINYRLTIAYEDLRRIERGEPTSQQIVDAQQRAAWAIIRTTIEAKRAPPC